MIMKLLVTNILRFKYTLFFTIYLCIVAGWASYSSLNGNVSNPAIVSVFSFIVISFLLSKIKIKLISSTVAVALSLIIAIDAYFAFVYKSVITLGAMASIFETNTSEAKEVIGDAIFMGLILLIATIFLFLKSIQEFRTVKIITTKVGVILLALYFLVVLPLMFYRKLSVNDTWMNTFKKNPVSAAQKIMYNHLPLVYGNILTYMVYRTEMNKIKEYINGERGLPEGVERDDSADYADKIVIVLGESSYRKHSSLYGYEKKTTPFLDSIAAENPSPLRFYDAISPGVFTRTALQIILSYASPANQEAFYLQKNIMELAKDAGYQTNWISNQPKMEKDGSYIGTITAFSDYSHFTDGVPDDLDLLPLFKKEYNSHKKQLFIIHLMGSHFMYDQRHDSIDDLAIPDGPDYQTTHYDRSIHHTDRVLEEIYRVIEKDSTAVMCYLSDHGEVIGLGHGFMNTERAQFDIPFVTINNTSLPVDSIVQEYLHRDPVFINTTNLIYLISELMGYSVSKELKSKLVADSKYILHADGNVHDSSTIIKD